MRKIILLLLALLLVCPALAEEDEEMMLEDMLSGIDASLLADIFINEDS